MFNRIAILLTTAATLTAAPANAGAQSLGGIVGDLLEVGLAARRARSNSTYMKSACLAAAPTSAFLAHATGDDAIIDDVANPPTYDRLIAREIMTPTTVIASFRTWEGKAYFGTCHFAVALQLPATVATHLNDSTNVQYDTVAKLTKSGDRWRLEDIVFTNHQFGDALRRAVRAAVTDYRNRQDAANQAREAMRRAETAAAEREFARTHPAEYAERQCQARLRARQLLDLINRTQEATFASERACIARGGIWTRRIGLSGAPIGPSTCRTR